MEAQRVCKQCGTALPPDAPEGLCPACLAGVGLGTDHGVKSPPGTNAPPPTPEEIGRHFPDLEILELLGQGGMGIVYKARQIKLDRLVALKILQAEAAKDPSFAERFSREARTLARLNHPNIVGIYDFGESDGLYYFLMEYVDGANLRQVESAGRLTPEQALQIVPRICDALQYAHEEGIVHRDIKPGNLLIDRRGRVKIADFGLAKLLGKSTRDLTLTGTHHVMGTPHYMAPEQVEHPQEVDHRADIYSLGVVFYEMLTGELPVGRFAPPSQKVQVDVRLDDVVLRTLEKEPEQRYQRAGDLGTDVETIYRGPPPPKVDAPEGRKPTVGGDSWKWSRGLALKRVHAPAVGLLVCGILNVLTLFVPGLAMGLRGVGSVLPAWPVRPFFVTEVWGWNPLTVLSFGSLLPLAASIAMIVGATKLKNLSSYAWALVAAILAILPIGSVQVLWLVGAAFGIWALIAIHLPEVRAGWGRSGDGTDWPTQSMSTTASAHVAGSLGPTAVISRKAIIGALIIALPFMMSLLIGLLTYVPMAVQHSAQPVGPIHRTVPEFGIFFVALIAPFAIGGPIATTILGFLAIKDIRHSNGRIVGLPLAVFDALLYPLLLLDLMIVVALVSLGRLATHLAMFRNFESHGLSQPILLLSILMGFAMCFLADFFIVRAVWQNAKRPAH